RGGGGHGLGPVQVPQRHVVGAGREDGRRYRVRGDGVRLAFPATGGGADHGQVGGDEVDRVRGEPLGEHRQQPGQEVGVGLGRLGRRQVEQFGGAYRVPLGQERQRHQSPRFAGGGGAGQQVVGGRADAAAQ